MNNANITSILASFATLKILYDSKKNSNPYQLLGEFINYVISEKALRSFSVEEMGKYLNEAFEFQIPCAVIKTACKQQNFLRKDNEFWIDDSILKRIKERSGFASFAKAKENAEKANVNILNMLLDFIKNDDASEEISGKQLSQYLIAYLIDKQEVIPEKYINLIARFVLENNNNKFVEEVLRDIKEGSILYIGINLNIPDVGSLKKPLTLFLDTEVLFNIVGYNGKLYEQLAQDFYSQVQRANKNGEIITLRFFPYVRDEIERFFKYAEFVVAGRMPFVVTKTALKTIINGCNNPSDVVIKKCDFYTQIEELKIIEDSKTDYYAKKYDRYNLENNGHKTQEDMDSWKAISHINKLREGRHASNDLESKYLFVTETVNTLRASGIQKEDCRDDFAVSTEKITNLLWYKLGNMLGCEAFPNNVDVVAKARRVLASYIGRRISEVYENALEEYKNNRITDVQFAARIIALRQKDIQSEDLCGNKIKEAMDFSPEKLSEIEKSSQKIVELKEEKERLERMLENQSKAFKDELYAKNEMIEARNKELDGYRCANKEISKNRHIKRPIAYFIAIVLSFLITQFAKSLIPTSFESKLNIICPSVFLVSLIGFVVLIKICFNKTVSKCKVLNKVEAFSRIQKNKHIIQKFINKGVMINSPITSSNKVLNKEDEDSD